MDIENYVTDLDDLDYNFVEVSPNNTSYFSEVLNYLVQWWTEPSYPVDTSIEDYYEPFDKNVLEAPVTDLITYIPDFF